MQPSLHDYMVLFAMVNAVGNLPMFASLTSGMPKATRGRTYRIAVAMAAVMVILFAILGNWMLRVVFQVDTGAFKIAGGLLVFAVAGRGVLFGPRQVVNPLAGHAGAYSNVAIFPMAFPFLVGPGTILTTIILMQTSGSLRTVTVAACVYLTVLPVLFLAPLVERAVGRVGVLVVTRVLYIFICAKAVSFVLAGIHASGY